jgi:hypothetical protein
MKTDFHEFLEVEKMPQTKKVVFKELLDNHKKLKNKFLRPQYLEKKI